jgi:hypothetical protein
MLTYKKQLTRKVLAISLPAGSYGVYLNNAWSFSGNTKGIRKMVWDGPAHFNTALNLGNQQGPGNQNAFQDKVTLFNISTVTNQPVQHPTYIANGHFGNDYRYGVEVDASDNNPWNGDDVFLSTYNPNASKIIAELDATNKVDLTVNSSDSSLTFGVDAGGPYYQFRNSAGSIQKVSYNPSNEMKLRIANKGVSVSGTMQGKVTVYTDPGYNINVSGNLVYADFSPSWLPSDNNGVPNNAAIDNFVETSQNILGLFSGNDLTITEGSICVTAVMFAVNSQSSTMSFQVDKSNQTILTLFGTLAANGFWDSKQGNDQATFNHTWDSRALTAPGLGFSRMDGNDTYLITFLSSSWSETNFK